MEATVFRIVSIGLVAENKAMQGSDGKWNYEIDATPLESMSMLDGDIKSNPEMVEASGVDRDGKNFSSSVAVDSTVTARWLPFGTNRITAPDVRRGERVLLWQAGDADKYYWTTTGMDDGLRKLETVIFAFSATQDESSGGMDLSKCYYLEVSTHNKAVTFNTSTDNGEPVEYTFQFNTGEGVVTLMDDLGNVFEMDSQQHLLTLQNADNTIVELNKTKFRMEATDEASFTVGGNKMVMVPAGTTWKSGYFKGSS